MQCQTYLPTLFKVDQKDTTLPCDMAQMSLSRYVRHIFAVLFISLKNIIFEARKTVSFFTSKAFFCVWYIQILEF